jgi:hypothetical protein
MQLNRSHLLASFATIAAAVVLGAAAPAACSSSPKIPQVPVETAWKDIDTAEANLQKSTHRLKNELIAAGRSLGLENFGDLGSAPLRQSLLRSLQAIQTATPALAKAATQAKAQVDDAIDDLRHDAGALQVGMVELVLAFDRGEANPPGRGDVATTMSRIKLEADGASGLIYYAEQIGDQLKRLGG